jgi:hypothetical protein
VAVAVSSSSNSAGITLQNNSKQSTVESKNRSDAPVITQALKAAPLDSAKFKAESKANGSSTEAIQEVAVKSVAISVQKPVDSPKPKLQAKANHPIHVPGAKKCEPPSQSLFSKKNCAPAASIVAHAVSVAELEEKKSARAFSVPLMDICKIDTPLVKRIPNSQRSAFATSWGRLLDATVLDAVERLD